jgi:hypothetical protein
MWNTSLSMFFNPQVFLFSFSCGQNTRIPFNIMFPNTPTLCSSLNFYPQTQRQKPLLGWTRRLLRSPVGLASSKVLRAEVINVDIFWVTSPFSPHVNLRSSETSVHVQTTWLYIPQDVNIFFDGLSSWPEFLYFDTSSDSFDTGCEVRTVGP